MASLSSSILVFLLSSLFENYLLLPDGDLPDGELQSAGKAFRPVRSFFTVKVITVTLGTGDDFTFGILLAFPLRLIGYWFGFRSIPLGLLTCLSGHHRHNHQLITIGGKERPKLEIEPNQARIVTYIFNLILEGNGLIEVAKQLNRERITGPKGKGWLKTTIAKIVTNEVYTGTLVWGRSSVRDLPPIRVENAWPAIINKDTFDQVQRLLKDRAPVSLHPKRVASRYLLSGLARCGYCGRALVGQDTKSGQFTYYVCGTLLKKGAGSCPTRYLNSQQFEGLVIDKIKEHVLTTGNLTRLVNMVNEEMDGLAVEYRQRLDGIVDEIADVNRRLERLYDALETGKISIADLAPRIQLLRQRLEQSQAAKWELEQQLSDRRVELADAETVAACVSDLHNLLSESSLAEKKSFVRSFVKEVKVTGDEVLLTYTIPMLPKGITEEKLPVLSIVHDGGR